MIGYPTDIGLRFGEGAEIDGALSKGSLSVKPEIPGEPPREVDRP